MATPPIAAIDFPRMSVRPSLGKAHPAAGAVLLMTAAQAAAQRVAPAAPALSGQTRTPDVRQLADRADTTSVAPATAAPTTQSAPKVGLRAVLGIRLSKDDRGAAILQTARESSLAARAGLRAGDRILAVNGVRVNSADEFVAMLHKQD
jgi:predicted metalloprotease with PDZ domain